MYKRQAQYRDGQYRQGEYGEGALDLTVDDVVAGLTRLGIDEHGLDRVDRKILDILLKHEEPVGLKTLAVSIGEVERTIEEVYEPYLIQLGMLLRTSRGRRASSRAQEIYGGKRSEGDDQFEQREFGLS